MRAGRLDKRFVIESASLAQDSYGAENPSWSTFATVWGAFMPLPGTEQYTADRKTEDVPIRIKMRYYPNVTIDMRVLHNSKYYDIISINELGRREGYELIVKLHRNG